MTTKQREDWLAQVRRGLLELCVLALIDQQATYGYELVTRLARAPQLAAGEGTVYPLLRRLRRDGMLSTVSSAGVVMTLGGLFSGVLLFFYVRMVVRAFRRITGRLRAARS